MARAVGDPAWRETLDRDGAIRCPAELDEATCGQIEAALGHLPEDRAGVRLRDMAGLTPLITAGSRIGGLASAALGADRPRPAAPDEADDDDR